MGKIDEIAELASRLGGQAPQPKYIRAYHGSPHDFDRFDASKIGTGEGAQAYGHGLYFASQEGVAKQYRDELRDMVENPLPHELSEELNQAWSAYTDASNKFSEWSRANSADKYRPNPFADARDAAAAVWTEVQGRVHAATHNPGRVYEVEIRHPEQSLLNWDLPSAGPAGVRGAEVLRDLRPREISASDLDYIRSLRPGEYSRPVYGSSIYGVEQSLRSMAKSPDGAAALQSAGVPGIRYLDGVSRNQGGGSRNYVVFPGEEDAIQIIRKYGWMLPAFYAASETRKDALPQVR